MKRSTAVFFAIAVALPVLAIRYLASPLSSGTRHVRVSLNKLEVAPGVNGYQAILVNEGLLPVYISRCETLSDAMAPDVLVGDAIQRWQQPDTWTILVQRSDCKLVPTGVIKAKRTRKLLWPKRALHTATFFPSVGNASSPFKRQDKLRFVIFVGTDTLNSGALTSPEFTLQ